MATDADRDPIEPLVQAARQGDGQALGQLLRRLWPWIRKKAGSYVAQSTLPISVSSLTQETALRLSQSIHKVRAVDSPAVKALLNRIIANTAHSAGRSAARLKRDPASVNHDDLMPDVQVPSDQQLERAEHEQAVLAAIELLPERQRQAVNLLRAGASYQDIAAELKCSLSAVHMILQRAKSQLCKVGQEPDSTFTLAK